MAKTNISQWDILAANNLDLNSISLAEGVTLPSSVNDLIREATAQLARLYHDLGANNTVSGSANAWVITTDQTFTALSTGLLTAFKPTAANTGAATANVDGLGAKAIQRKGDSALQANDMLANGIYLLKYDAAYNSAAGAWVLLNPETSLTLGTGVATFLGTPSSANLLAAVTDETGTGALVFANGPTLIAPVLGTPASGVATNLTGTAASLTSGITQALKSATTTVDVSAATAPTANQVLTATDSTHATWQAASGGQPIPASSTLAVGTMALAANSSAGAVANGSTTSGTNLRLFAMDNSGGSLALSTSVSLTGTWKNISGATSNQNTNGASDIAGYWVRTV